MPYKNKEDRTKAVKRHREKKKKEQEEIEAGEEFQKKLTDILKDLGFKTIPYRDLVEILQEDCIVEEDGVRNRKTGKLENEPEIFFGLNLMIAVETLHMTVPKVD